MTTLTVNGESRSIKASPDTPLLYVLRDELGLNSAKYGCGLGQCGACTVIVDGKAIFSCIMPVMVLEGRTITTLEGLGSLDAPGPMQRAFIAEQAAQCGYCIPGMMMRAQALLNRDPHAPDESIRAELQPHSRRWGTPMRIFGGVRGAAEKIEPKAADARTGR